MKICLLNSQTHLLYKAAVANLLPLLGTVGNLRGHVGDGAHHSWVLCATAINVEREVKSPVKILYTSLSSLYAQGRSFSTQNLGVGATPRLGTAALKS